MFDNPYEYQWTFDDFHEEYRFDIAHLRFVIDMIEQLSISQDLGLAQRLETLETQFADLECYGSQRDVSKTNAARIVRLLCGYAIDICNEMGMSIPDSMVCDLESLSNQAFAMCDTLVEICENSPD